ncbi:toll/interleukin-1 receptor domain-containing protein [Stenotrophomonas sp. BSUC-16]|uniref:toll/interleukin-1 receptor domain-containing protein n=1 Tax=Stenotrophomonas sp. BSUC-16 TaxID=3156074 RepID=UPI00339AF83A
MIQYITKSELRDFASQITFREQVNLRESAARLHPAGSTFLSHSSKDDDLVIGAIRVLEGHGARVYVDEIDPEMPPYTNDETAALLRKRIHQTRSFVLLASKNSRESKWVPWELGIADGAKGFERLALFPALDNSYDEDWTSWEYLGLYRRIVWGNLEGYKDPVWMVFDKERNSATELRRWLTAAS